MTFICLQGSPTESREHPSEGYGRRFGVVYRRYLVYSGPKGAPNGWRVWNMSTEVIVWAHLLIRISELYRSIIFYVQTVDDKV